MRRVSNYLWGVALIVLGVLWGLNALDVVNLHLYPGWWTLFIIVPCLIGLCDGRGDTKTWNLIGLLIGVFLQLSALGALSFDLVVQLIIPIVLIVAGGGIILHAVSSKQPMERRSKRGEAKFKSALVERKMNFDGQEFSGCTLDATLGGVKCDLRRAKIAKNAKIRANAVFGGIIIYVPHDVEIKVVNAGVMLGGVEDNRKYYADTMKATLNIEAHCFFGGIEIKNA